MYKEMLEFVKHHLERTNPFATSIQAYPFRDRFAHIERVLSWAVRINAVEQGDCPVVRTAAIFHDVGKAAVERPHAEVSAEICEQYLRSQGFCSDFVTRVAQTVRLHSNKHLPKTELTLEEQILIDADLLDESAGLMILWESMDEGSQDEQSYLKTYARIRDRYYQKIEIGRYIKTVTGRRLFDANLRFVEAFLHQLRLELGLD